MQKYRSVPAFAGGVTTNANISEQNRNTENHSIICNGATSMEQRKRVFKTKTFDRWSRKILDDAILCKAAREIEQGVYEADLGHGVCKKRIAVPGKGKSAGTRTLVAKQHRAAIIFLAGREKSSPGADFSQEVVGVAMMLAAAFNRQSIEQLALLATEGNLKEICNA